MLDRDVAHHPRYRTSETGRPVGAGEAGIGIGDHAAGDDENDRKSGGGGGEAADHCGTAPENAKGRPLFSRSFESGTPSNGVARTLLDCTGWEVLGTPMMVSPAESLGDTNDRALRESRYRKPGWGTPMRESRYRKPGWGTPLRESRYRKPGWGAPLREAR